MTPQEINEYIDKLAKEGNVSRAKAEQMFWKAYLFVENEPQHPSFGYMISSTSTRIGSKMNMSER